LDTVELELPAAPTAPRFARAVLRDTLERWHLEALLDVAALLTSELVTNVVHHVGAPMTLRVSRDVTTLRVEVDDRSPASPSVRHVRPQSEHGRGVFLVDALASDWGTERTAAGKTVWFELELEVASAAAEARGG
jgi:anti-sigma regulatory factor (Ser/Thr protein kinase)